MQLLNKVFQLYQQLIINFGILFQIQCSIQEKIQKTKATKFKVLQANIRVRT